MNYKLHNEIRENLNKIDFIKYFFMYNLLYLYAKH